MTPILMADDDPSTRLVLRIFLKRWDFRVIEAADGAEAWSILQQPDAPRIAILDWMMPKIDGADLCARLRARPNAPYLYILLLTARGNSADIAAGLRAGADDYVCKPFIAEELRLRLEAGLRVVSRLPQQLEKLSDPPQDSSSSRD